MRAALDRVDLCAADARASAVALLRREARRARTATARRPRRGTAARPRSRSCHISACMRWYASSRLIFAARPATRGIVVLHQRRDADLVGGLVEPAPRDRVRPVEQVQLDERRAAVLVERRGRTRARRRRPSDELVDRARVADLVLRDRRERDVLLEHRRDARPLGVAPAEDELVVSERRAAAARSRASFSRALIE